MRQHVVSTADTIVAVATPAGYGGVGIVRLSGPESGRIGQLMAHRTRPWPPRRVVRSSVTTAVAPVDALITFFSAPASYTGEDVLEISVVGNPLVLSAVVRRAVELGARAARRGEFTLRAVVRGKMDLAQAEGLRDLVAAVSPAQVRQATGLLDGTLSGVISELARELRSVESMLEASLDFPEEGYHFISPVEAGEALRRSLSAIDRILGSAERMRVLRDGATVVIAGAPNVGKSSLFNAILGGDRAIVASSPGTTRDLVTERVMFGESAVLLVDTAGLRGVTAGVEEEGIRRARAAVGRADVVVLVLDGSRPLSPLEVEFVRELEGRPGVVVVVNKCDLARADEFGEPLAGERPTLHVSARSGVGVDTLRRVLDSEVRGIGGSTEDAIVTCERQRQLLSAARDHLARAAASVADFGGAALEELLAADVREALQDLEDVVGRRSTEELLDEIFVSFCIGK